MADETKTPEQVEIDYVDLLQKSEEARKKAEADLVKSRSNERKWMDQVLNSTPQQEQSKAETGPSSDELRKIILNADGQCCDLEYTKALLKLREKEIERTGKDPLIGYNSKNYEPGVDERRAERIVSILQECVDASGDDPSVFKAMFNSRLNN